VSISGHLSPGELRGEPVAVAAQLVIGLCELGVERFEPPDVLKAARTGAAAAGVR